MALLAPVTPGELLDRISILELKASKAPGTEAQALLEALRPVEASLGDLGGVRAEIAELAAVNARLWDVEDRVRELMRAGAPADALLLRDFAAVAASVPRLNDRRAALKRALDAALRPGAPSEPKVYV